MRVDLQRFAQKTGDTVKIVRLLNFELDLERISYPQTTTSSTMPPQTRATAALRRDP